MESAAAGIVSRVACANGRKEAVSGCNTCSGVRRQTRLRKRRYTAENGCRRYFEGAQPSNRPSKVTGTSIRSSSSDIGQQCLDRWGVEYTKWFFLKSQARSFSLFLFLFRQILNWRKRRSSNRHLICRHDCGQSKSRKNHGSLCDRPGIAYRDEYNFSCPAEETIPAENRAASSFHCRFECPLSPGGLVQSAGFELND